MLTSTSLVGIRLPAFTSCSKSDSSASASHAAAPSGLSARKIASSVTQTRLSRSRKEPGSAHPAVAPVPARLVVA